MHCRSKLRYKGYEPLLSEAIKQHPLCSEQARGLSWNIPATRLPMRKRLFLLVGLFAMQPALADWRVDAESSRVAFIASKNASQFAIGRFYGLLGGVDQAGKLKLKIELDSLRTGVLLQDQRLRKELFETASFAFAEVRGQLDMPPITNLAPGAQLDMQLPVTLSLHGVEKMLSLDLLVTRLDAHRFQVVSFTPVVLDAADFGLSAALDSLRSSVGLDSISLAVPVSAVLIFSER